MELRHLRYFVAVAEELHFSRAAARLHVSQPPLSQQIKALESELGVVLFNRSRRQVALTEAGRHFLVEVQAILARVERATDRARRAAVGEFGELSLGFTGSFPFLPVMPRIIRGFRGAHPHVQLDLRELSTAAQIERVTEDKLDVGFIRPLSVEGLGALELMRLATEPLVVVLHGNHALAPRSAIAVADLADEPFILYAQRLGTGFTQQVVDLCRSAGFRPRVVQEVEEMPTIIGLVSAGLGVSIVSASMQRIRLPDVVYRPLREKRARAEFFLAFRRDTASAIVKNFVRHARHAVQGDPQTESEPPDNGCG